MIAGRSQAAAALTLLETMVVIAVIILLILVTLPAVQSAREAARAAHCRNNLRQIGVALLSYHDQYGMYPTARAATYNVGALQGSWKAYSALARLLPYLGQESAFNSINFSQTGVGYPANETVFGTRIAVFLCPSDPHDLATYARSFGLPNPLIIEGLPGSTNYRINLGGPYTGPWESQPDSGLGPFAMFYWRKAAEVSDGLSNTVMVAEKIKGDGDKSAFSQHGDFWYSHAYDLLGRLPEQSLIMKICASLRAKLPEHYSFGGALWIRAGYENTYYNHVVGPNSEIPDCAADGGLGSVYVNGGVFGARSFHSAGVGVLFGDGSVRFVSGDIDLRLWRALGTIAGHEPVQLDAF